MRFGSVCSGIEASSAAWMPFGWRCAFMSEIEDFPRAVLSHHYPEAPLHGDFTTIRAGEYEPIDVLVGGTPCQSFSVAGLRGGMADERGNLALEYLRLAERLRPRWLVWENVPGVLSSGAGRDFGAFVGGLAELGYGWAYRVLDAQYFGLAQRRKRVFVVGHFGDWRRAAAVLFEPASLRWNPPPSRAKGERVADSLTVGANQCSGTRSNPYGDHESREGLLVAHSLRAGGFDASEDGTGRGTPLVTSFDWQAGGGGSDKSFKGKSRSYITDRPGRTRALTSNKTLAIAFQTSQSGVRDHETHATLDANNDSRRHNGAIVGSAARRLTPRECERLQGFPDDYTRIPFRGRLAADGPRYRALGNSMAVPVMSWIGQRIGAQA